MDTNLINTLSALLTPTIAVITTYIAVQQYRSGKAKFRHELYDRRMAVYKAANNYLSVVVVGYTGRDNAEEEEKEAFKEFVATNAETAFLFDNEVVMYLASIHITGGIRLPTRYMMKMGDPVLAKEQEQKLAETTQKHQEQLYGLRDVFMKYLDLKNLK